MLQIATHLPDELWCKTAEKIADRLCRPGSEMQGVFARIAAGEEANCDPGLVFAVASRVEDDDVVIGWASVSYWNGGPAVQGFVTEEYRRKGLAGALLTAIVCDHEIPMDHASVFSPHLVGPAKRAGFQSVTEWHRVDDGWIKRDEQ